MSKLSVSIIAFRPFRRNTLHGFCDAYIGEVHLTIYDISVHQHANGARWASLPSKPLLDRDGAVKRTTDGKIEYARLLSFNRREVGDAFSAAIVAALLEYAPTAFDESAA
jgi:hypothetical protein